MTAVNLHKCDVCGEIIPEHLYGTDGFLGMSILSQEFPVGDKVYDVCKKCCLVLGKLENLGIIPRIDRDMLYDHCGYEFVEEGI